MADDIKVDEGTGPVVATDEVGSRHYQYVKPAFGPNNTATLVSTSDPLPTVDAAAKTLLEAVKTLLEGVLDVSGSVTVSGVSTSSKQDTLIGHVDGVEALLTTIDADTGNLAGILAALGEIEEDTDSLAAIKTSVETIDNAIAGSEMQVDVVGSLPAGNNNIGDVDIANEPTVKVAASQTVGISAGTAEIGKVKVTELPALVAGTAAIGKLAANSGVDIGDVDVTSLPAIPTGSNSIGKVKSIEEALPAGTNAIGKLAANSGVDIGDVTLTEGSAAIGKLAANSGVDIGDVTLTAGSALVGDVGLGVRVEGGLSIHKNLDVDETEDAVKAEKGQIYWYHYANRTAEELFLKFYNATVATVEVGTTTPAVTIPLAKESQGHVPIPQGLAFSTAITVACVKGVADNSSTGPAANGCVITVGYA